LDKIVRNESEVQGTIARVITGTVLGGGLRYQITSMIY